MVTIQLNNMRPVEGACYVIVNADRQVVPIQEGRLNESFALGLGPYQRTVQSYAEQTAARQAKSQLSVQIAEAERQYANALRALGSSPAFRSGRCVAPVTPPLPDQPPNSYPATEAETRATSAVVDAIVDRVGCNLSPLILRIMGLASRREQFKNALECMHTTRPAGVPYSPSPALELILATAISGCGNKDESCWSWTLVGLTLAAMADIQQVTEALNGPYESWRREIYRLKDEPLLAFNQCSEAAYVVERFPSSNRDLLIRSASAEESIKVADAMVQRTGSTIHGSDALQCSRMIDEFVVRRGSPQATSLRTF